MKKNFKFISIVFISIFIVILLSIKSVNADSGWDTDYDSGGGWDSGSDWDSGWDSGSDRDSNYHSGGGYSNSDSSSVSDKTFLMLIILVVVGRFVIWIISNLIRDSLYNRRKFDSINLHQNQVPSFNEITFEQANEIIPGFNIGEFDFKIFKMFEDIQKSWMNFEYNKLKILLTDELYNSYEMDLEILKSKNQKNVMFDFENISTKLIELKKENNQFIATVVLNAKFYDYIENENGVILRGNPKRKVNNIYILTFVKSIEDIKERTCPNCGSKVTGNTTGVCQYCESKIIFNEFDWVMSKKQKISQR